ncbi:MAG: hypothetical protein QM754_14620 [Tepidisphaeraceae bacterium]
MTTYIRHPDFAEQAKPIHATIAQIDAGSVKTPSKETVGSQAWFADKPHVPQLQRQMAAPVTLSHLLPPGIKGLFVAIMIMGLLAGDAGHLHSWGSIFVQDVLLPMRKKPLSTRAHIWALRGAVMFVALFAFGFSIVYAQSQYIALWWALTGGVFTGGAGAAIIGGLYWKRGTTQAAWAGTLTGSILALVGVAMTSDQVWPIVRDMAARGNLKLPPKFWFNGLQTAFIAAIIAVLVYVITSLLTSKRGGFDLDAMLHRDSRDPMAPVTPFGDRFRLKNILKFDSNFTFSDKMVSGGIFWWSMLLLALNVVVSGWNITYGHWPTSWWANYWAVTGIALPFVIAVVTLVWFGIGGFVDIRSFFHTLRTMKRDAEDDGRVVHADALTNTPPAEMQPTIVERDTPIAGEMKALSPRPSK